MNHLLFPRLIIPRLRLPAGFLLALLTMAGCGSSSGTTATTPSETTVSGATASSQTERVRLTHHEQQRRVSVTVDGKPFTAYIYPESIKKPVLFPIRTAQGTAITRGYPMEPVAGERVDHPHHVGLWFNHGDVNGHDFWNNSDQVKDKPGLFGTIRHRAVKRMESGADQAELEVTMDWLDAQGQPLLLEETTFVFGGQGTTRTIDRITKLTALDKEVLFKDNKEGVLGLRVARFLEHPSNKAEIFTDASGQATPVAKLDNEGVTGKYRSSEGVEGEDVWSTRARWMNLTGTTGQEAVAVAILDHPQNPNFPTHWHSRGYGLYAANPLGSKVFSKGAEELNLKLNPGESTTFRHRIIIQSGGGLADGELNTAFGRFSARP